MSKQRKQLGYFGISSWKGKHTQCGSGGVCCKARLELSQYATLLVLGISFLLWVLHSVKKISDESPQSGAELFYSVSIPLLPLFVAALYYFVGAWLVESKLEHFLPPSGMLMWIERGIRGSLLVLIPLSFAAIEKLAWLTPYRALCIFFLLMLVWDAIIAASAKLKGGRKLAGRFCVSDGICFFLSAGNLVAVSYNCEWWPIIFTLALALGAFVSAAFCVYYIVAKTFPEPEWGDPL